ncbi:MAG TPA: hypothetical protein VL172_00870, partial [Kofleriaceae bacterium]|nr:hypothetical protein [Kofleriaceae bacterium]
MAKWSVRLCVVVLAGCLADADDQAPVEPAGDLPVVDEQVVLLDPLPEPEDAGPVAPISVAELDRSTSTLAADATLPVEARLLVISADGSEPELAAIRAVFDHRGVPYDVFIATSEPELTAGRLSSAGHGFYQGIVLTTSSLSVGGSSALSASEWAVLADYEQSFVIRRAVLAAWADPALGFGAATTVNTSTAPVSVSCTSAGAGLFRDVNCSRSQQINGDTAYLSTPVAGAPLTPLLADGAGHALAAIHRGSDGRESLLLLFRQQKDRLHSLLFLHGVLGWVSGGTYLGERRIDIGVQVDDLFIASTLYKTTTAFRIAAADLRAMLTWVQGHRAQPSTPDFHLSLAFNGRGATAGDGLTAEAVAENPQWNWLSHTFTHHELDDMGYDEALSEFTRNIQLAEDLPLQVFDLRSLVTGSVTGLVNPQAMQAAYDAGVRYAVTDTSRAGCDNPSPNTTFYDVIQPGILLVPRRPAGMGYNVSTPAQWTLQYNDDHGSAASYAEVVDKTSDRLLLYLMRGEGDPWMYHQANLRAYDGVHSILGDLLDATISKVEARLRVPMRTPTMTAEGQRFARRIDYETAGVRATLFRGRALVIETGRALTVPVTGVRPGDGEAYGGDVIGMVAVPTGNGACVPLDAAGVGCSPAPVRDGEPGPVSALPTGYCDASDLPKTYTAVAHGATWRYWDRGNLASGWQAPGYGDAGWATGPGPLGYGETYLR